MFLVLSYSTEEGHARKTVLVLFCIAADKYHHD
jgi:hypothetical protein